MKKTKTLQEIFKIIEEPLKAIETLQILTPDVEPPPNSLTQNQVFAAGQMNMIMRVREHVDEVTKRLKALGME